MPERIAILGTGIMGSAFARRALSAGFSVKGWSVPISDAEALEPAGLTVAPTAAAAATDADIVVTMVPDAGAIESFAHGPDGFLSAMGEGSVWVQSSTIGVEPADRLIALAEQHEVTIVDAPVLGSKEPAEAGEIVILASGPTAALSKCRGYFEAISRKTLDLGEAGRGSRMKMVTNHWIMCSVASIAETMALSRALGLEGERFLEALAGTQIDMGYAQIKGRMMIERSYPTQLTLTNGVKDATLVHTAAAEQGLPALVSAAAVELLSRAAEIHDGNDDMAAAFEAAIVRGQ